MAKRNTRRNKCLTCGEHYKSFHFCKNTVKVKFSKLQNPDSWDETDETFFVTNNPDWSNPWSGALISGNEYTRAKSVDDFDDWFASIEKYIEERLNERQHRAEGH